MSHPMMPQATHDERAEQLFVRDLKVYLAEQIGPHQGVLAAAVEREIGEATGPAEVEAVRDGLMQHEIFRAFASTQRTSQEMMWDSVVTSVDRQLDSLTAKAKAPQPKGSLRLDPAFVPPTYVTDFDIHLMPGGYGLDTGEGGLRQGAVMDRGGAVYMLGRNGGLMNDQRGHTLAQHVMDLYPDLEPERIIEMGCGVGVSLVPFAGYFPEAEIHGVDLGADMLRYAHARAESLGAGLHLSQQNAERTDFQDGSFDLVFSCVLFHETSAKAIGPIIKECHRLLRPGGVMAHLEVPLRYADMDLWARIRGELEVHYNNEPFWRGAISADYAALFAEAGFEDMAIGYRPATAKAVRGVHAFTEKPLTGWGNWFVASARK